MAQILQAMLPFVGVTGRVLLGLYFLIPGISKIVGFGGTAQYMATHGVPFVAVLLPITILVQIGGGAAPRRMANPSRRSDTGWDDLGN